MIRSATFGIRLLLAVPAVVQSLGEKSGVNSMAGVAPSTQDFATEAAQSDMFVIQSNSGRPFSFRVAVGLLGVKI